MIITIRTLAGGHKVNYNYGDSTDSHETESEEYNNADENEQIIGSNNSSNEETL